MGPIQIALVFLGGLLLGGLLNVVIIRLPREKRLLGWPRCTRTGAPLALWHMLPVVGWLLQRGRAANGAPLHPIHPLVELFTALVLALLALRYGLSPLFAYLACVCAVLIVTGAIDWLHRYIYTMVILGSALLALLANIVAARSLPGLNGIESLVGLVTAGIGFIILFALSLVLFPGASVPFGMGDVYLGIFIGAAFGVSRLFPALMYGVGMAGLVAAVLVVRKYVLHHEVPTYMPYGSYLCLGAIVYLLVHPWVG